MSYYSKILVLKEYIKGFSVSERPVSGICKLESDNMSYFNLKISLINLASVASGTYYLLFFDGVHFSFFDIGQSPVSKNFVFTDKISAENGFISAIAFIENDNIKTILFNSSIKNYEYEKFKEVIEYEFTKKFYKPKETVAKKEESPVTELQTTYNDEIVATENYYLNKDVDLKNLSVNDTENQKEKEPPKPVVNSIEETTVKNENEEIKQQKPEGKEPIKEAFQFEYKEKDTVPYGENKKYYIDVKDELDKLFNNNKREDCLCEALPGSEWVRVNFSDTKYYVVGLIKENNEPKYICYGVPSKYSKYPPPELAGFCSFMPISVFNLQGDGFWMLYQDAITGECIKFKTPN